MDLTLALTNLTSIPVLAFALGVLAARLKTDLSVSNGAYEAISFVLLLSIGFKGGIALQTTDYLKSIGPFSVTLVLGFLIPLLAFLLLRFMPKLGKIDRGSVAAHYGSTSLVTFSAALVFLENAGIAYEGIVTTLLVIMEIPGILVGIVLARGGMSGLADRELLREVFLGKTVVLLFGGLLIGLLAGHSGFEKVKPLFVDAMPGLLTIFLLTLGIKAGQKLGEFKVLGWKMAAFAIVFPVLAGFLGVALGTVSGLSVGGTTALAVLCASASYIAAPAAVSVALPTASKSIALVNSLAVTFPFNLILGIPLYLQMAQWLGKL